MFEKVRAFFHTSDIRAYPLYSATIFLSAFLLFQIQPMIARHLLPLFGGAVSVWAASLVFFTSTLFFGYTYVYALSGLRRVLQVRVHGVLLAFSAFFTISVFIFSPGGYIPVDVVFSIIEAPSLQVVLALLITIGLPYFLLSTTGPLLQQWYANDTGSEPYHLYSLSNVGSLLALTSFPFVIEPTLGLTAQNSAWTLLFVVYVVLLAHITWRRSRVPEEVQEEREHAGEVSVVTIGLWLALSALPAAMLVATTTRITQTIAPVPFLWIVPLALYLLSFILAFRGWGSRGPTPLLLLVAALMSYVFLDWNFETTGLQILSNVALFFFGALYCHAILYSLRPPSALSSYFYFWTSLGGALGTLVVALVAPVVFTDVLEFPLGILAFVFIAISVFPAMRYVRDEFKRGVILIKFATLIGVIVFIAQNLPEPSDTILESTRNFYGVVHVHEYDNTRTLQHGTTMHGSQFTDAAREHEPTTYYSPTSGVGRAIVNAKEARGGDPISVGVIGLGVGTLAAYCEKGDHFTFFEIDERIGRIANEFFSFLENCERADIKYGDGRLSMKQEREAGKLREFDVLAIDAFSDDTIPVHLLTKEAVELYLQHLRAPDGVLAIHTSNRFFELSPVVMKASVELGLSAMVIADNPETEGATKSEWVLLSRDATALQKPIFADAARMPPPLYVPLWTDDYANVFASFELPPVNFWQDE